MLVASKGGYPKNPAWFHNLRANPDTTRAGRLADPRTCARASPTGAERERLWTLMVGVYWRL